MLEAEVLPVNLVCMACPQRICFVTTQSWKSFPENQIFTALL